MADLARMTPQAVADLARQHGAQAVCGACKPLGSAGWESFPAAFDDSALELIGVLWSPGDGSEEPTLEELRPAGVDQWSAQAPIALGYFPYNRCQVWCCRACRKPFLRYTEYGGYYVDQRIRELDPALLVV